MDPLVSAGVVAGGIVLGAVAGGAVGAVTCRDPGDLGIEAGFRIITGAIFGGTIGAIGAAAVFLR